MRYSCSIRSVLVSFFFLHFSFFPSPRRPLFHESEGFVCAHVGASLTSLHALFPPSYHPTGIIVIRGKDGHTCLYPLRTIYKIGVGNVAAATAAYQVRTKPKLYLSVLLVHPRIHHRGRPGLKWSRNCRAYHNTLESNGHAPRSPIFTCTST